MFAPGDGGWRGFAVTIAQTMASWGYDVYGLDTKHYLESFTGKTTLTESQAAADMRAAGEWTAARSKLPVLFVGWSEGGGLAVLAGAGPGERRPFAGIVVIGLPERAFLGWRWSDNITWVTKQLPNEPVFQTAPYVAKIAPLPLAMIHSTNDEYTTVEAARRTFAAAAEPRWFAAIESRNHRFEGAQEKFFKSLQGALAWTLQPRN